jgi:FeoB-associated Cys-rich membrane protein
VSAEYQTIAALAIVAVAAMWLVLRAVAKRKNTGCGADCSCPTEKLKR